MNGNLYRVTFAIVVLALLVLAFTIATPAPLAKPPLPGSFDTISALQLATDLSTGYPDRAPGSGGAKGAVTWFEEQLPITTYGLRMQTSSWYEHVPGLGQVQLTNIAVVAPGSANTADTIVVMAHRDDIGEGEGANDNASGTAALIELARSYAQPQTEAPARVSSPRQIVFLSTDGGAFGGLGAIHFLEHPPSYNGRVVHVVAVINLDAIAGPGHPAIEIAGDSPRSPNANLVATTVARIAEQAGVSPHHVGLFGQLADLAFPFTLYEQGPFVAKGIPAITITTGGDRPPPPFGDSAEALDRVRLGELGSAAQQLLGSLDQGISFGASTPSYVWVGGRAVRGWAIELVLIALLLPFGVAIVDVYALCRRHHVVLAPAARALRSRLGFWLFVGIVFTCFRLLGAWPSGPARPPDPGTAVAGDWPVLVLLALLLVLVLGWSLARQRLVPRRRVTAEEELAGYTVGLAALLVVALLVTATNPFALLFVLPSLHIWLWLPQLRIARPPVRLGLFVAGLCGPALLLISLALRYGLGFDAPWYLLELVGIGYISPLAFAIALAGTAAAAQLAVTAAGRYTPYPDATERGPRGPIRDLVRVLVLGARARRRRLAAASPASTA